VLFTTFAGPRDVQEKVYGFEPKPAHLALSAVAREADRIMANIICEGFISQKELLRIIWMLANYNHLFLSFE
jgi:hypothetical protein